jgi:prepilin-type N-terminal cleavage/methylation domain-containing protein
MKFPRRAFTLTELLVVIFLIVVLLFCLCGFAGPVGRVLLGWAFFLVRVIPEVRPRSSLLLTAGVSLAGALVGVHLFARWLVGSLPPRPPEALPRRWSFVSTLALVGVVVLAFTAGIGAVGVTHQASWLAHSPEPIMRGGLNRAVVRIKSSNNLKQIGLACHNYHDNAERLPPAVTFDAHGRALHGWLTYLLPYVEQEGLFKQIDLSRPWDGPANAPHFRTSLSIYLHPLGPAADDQEWALTHYALNVRLVNGGSPLRLDQLPRGLANTLLAGEAAGDWKPWGHPVGWRDPAGGINRSPGGFGSPVRGAHSTTFLMADGSVRTFKADTDPEFLALLGGAGPGR